MIAIQSMFIIIGYSVLILFLYLVIAFIVGTVKKNNGLMDVFYGPGYFVIAVSSLILYFIANNEINIRQIIVTLLVFIWALRLYCIKKFYSSLHISRNCDIYRFFPRLVHQYN